MKNKRVLSLILVISLIFTTANSYSFSLESFKDAAIGIMNKDFLQKIGPFLVFAAFMGCCYWMSLKNRSTNDDNDNADLPKVIQLDVYNQFDSDGGGNASCGYHTLLRAMQFVASKNSQENDEVLSGSLTGVDVIQLYFSNGNEQGIWRKAIAKERKNNEIKNLFKKKLYEAFKKENEIDGYDSKAVELYKSSLGVILEKILSLIEHNSADHDYEFNDEAIISDIDKSLSAEIKETLDVVKSSKTMRKYLDFDKMRQELLCKQEILKLKPNVEAIQQKHENGEWLNDGEMEMLWEKGSKEIIPKVLCGFKAISNFGLIGREGFDEVTPYIQNSIKQKLALGEESFHVFAIGSMSQNSDTSGSSGHWFPLIMHHKKDKTRNYYVMDSIGKDCTNDEKVKKLIQMIEA